MNARAPKARIVVFAVAAIGGLTAGCFEADALSPATGATKGSVKIVKKTVEIPRKEGEGADVAYPEFVMPDKEAAQRLEATAGLKAGFGMSLEKCKTEVAEGTWLQSIDYAVDYNQDDILSLTYTMEGMGAYPSETVSRVSVRISTAKPLGVEETFRPEGRKTLAGFIDQRLQKAIKSKLAELEPDDQAELRDMLDSRKSGKPVFRVKNLEGFEVVEDGVAFFYEFDFPFAHLALEPDERFVLSFQELWTFLEKKGPLGFAAEPEERFQLN